MVTKGEINYLSSLVRIIRDSKSISTVNLVLQSRKSLSYFEKMRKFLVALYLDIEYDREKKLWIANESENISN